MNICPNPKCKAIIKEGANFCPKCGHKFKVDISKVICHSCGEENDIADRVCRRCGEYLTQERFFGEDEIDVFGDDSTKAVSFEKLRKDALITLYKEKGLTWSGDVITSWHCKTDEEEDKLVIPSGAKIVGQIGIRSVIKELIVGDGIEKILGGFAYCKFLKHVELPASIIDITGDAFKDTMIDTLVVHDIKSPGFSKIMNHCFTMPNKKIVDDATMYDGFGIRDRNREYSLVHVHKYMTYNEDGIVINLKQFREDTLRLAEKNRKRKNPNPVENKDFKIVNGNLLEFVSYGTAITIPENVIKINDETFKKYTYCKKIESITLSNNLKVIGNRAFMNLSKLRRIEFPNSLETIGEEAFAKCLKIDSLSFGNNVKEIKDKAFYELKNLKEVSLPNSLTKLSKGIFSNCIALKRVELPKGIRVINEEAFANCEVLSSINLDNIIEIGKSAFLGCQAFQDLELANSLKTIGEQAFYNCSNLRRVNIDNVSEIGGFAFYGCRSIHSIQLSKSLKVIKESTFANCTNLKKINLDNVSIIMDGAFSGCNNLSDVTLSNNTPVINNKVFANCTSLKKIELPNSIKEIKANAFNGCVNLSTINLPNGIEVIGDSAFKNCHALKYVIIPNSVEKIDGFAFGVKKKEDCKSLKVIYIPNGKTFKDFPKGVKVKKYKLEQLDKIKEKLLKLK